MFFAVGSVKLRTLNRTHGSIHGGDKMHVIGQPFIKGPSLSIVFATPHGDVTASNPELYSDSVLFFDSPPYPCPAVFSPYFHEPVRELKVQVRVTNDGRTMSNPLDFTYVAGMLMNQVVWRLCVCERERECVCVCVCECVCVYIYIYISVCVDG